MSKISITPSATGTGTFTISSPATNTNRTLTLPDEAGTVLTSASSITQNAGAVFSVYHSTSQSLTSSGFTLILFDTEEFDTSNNFASNKFTPTVEGYYQLNSFVRTNYAPASEWSIFVFKNNSPFKMGTTLAQGTGNASSGVSTLVYANGSTDFFEIRFYSGAATTTAGSSTYQWFNGFLVRTA